MVIITYDDVLTADEAMKALKVGKNALYVLLNSGKLKAYHFTRRSIAAKKGAVRPRFQ